MRALQHNIVFFAKHWKMPSNTLLYMLLTSTMGETKISRFIKSPSSFKWWKHKRTYIAGQEQLDEFYTPFIRVDHRYQDYFRPTKLTNDKGYLVDELMEDFPLPINPPVY